MGVGQRYERLLPLMAGARSLAGGSAARTAAYTSGAVGSAEMHGARAASAWAWPPLLPAAPSALCRTDRAHGHAGAGECVVLDAAAMWATARKKYAEDELYFVEPIPPGSEAHYIIKGRDGSDRYAVGYEPAVAPAAAL
eukprot:SAG11_NODE_7868_length_1086_cov_1.407295_1_plen_139_part_00